jgi:hypothetical protein
MEGKEEVSILKIHVESKIEALDDFLGVCKLTLDDCDIFNKTLDIEDIITIRDALKEAYHELAKQEQLNNIAKSN